jgi:hypothetical protein
MIYLNSEDGSLKWQKAFNCKLSTLQGSQISLRAFPAPGLAHFQEAKIELQNYLL